MSGRLRSPKVGKLRPSQAVTQHGPGAVVDLPELSVIIAGIDHWHPTSDDVVPEPRLESFLRVQELIRPPQPGPGRFGGVPSFVFPEYLVCPNANCRFLAPWTEFTKKSGWSYVEFRCPRADKHSGPRQPTAFPARFMVACPVGHLDDFPWRRWVHGDGGGPCSGALRLIDRGTTGSASDLWVECTGCDRKRNLGDAFKKGAHGGCTGRRPWLGLRDHEPCGETGRTILRGASNAYFPVAASAISVPPWSDPIHQEIAPYLKVIREQARSPEKLKSGVEDGYYDLGDLLVRYSIEELWRAATAEAEEEDDLRKREWQAFIHPEAANKPGSEFEVKTRSVPSSFTERISQVVAGSRLREVRALRGFTRIDSMPEIGEEHDIEHLDIEVAPLSVHKHPSWLPAVDLRGEGVFIRFSEDALRAWEARPALVSETARVEGLWHAWQEGRPHDDRSFPGMRYVLLHTFSHVLMRELALDSGYSTSSIRERIYCAGDPQPMAGVLLYTATSDSDGSLGGLVDQSRPDRLQPLILNALREASRCAQDPLCGSLDVGGSEHLNGSACHACLLLAETSCEFGNRLLDRSVLVDTLGRRGIEYFDGH